MQKIKRTYTAEDKQRILRGIDNLFKDLPPSRNVVVIEKKIIMPEATQGRHPIIITADQVFVKAFSQQLERNLVYFWKEKYGEEHKFKYKTIFYTNNQDNFIAAIRLLKYSHKHHFNRLIFPLGTDLRKRRKKENMHVAVGV